MSWLSKLWRGLKRSTGLTDSEIAFGILLSRLSRKDRDSLEGKLRSVEFAADVASGFVDDPRIEEALMWTQGALRQLERFHKP